LATLGLATALAVLVCHYPTPDWLKIHDQETPFMKGKNKRRLVAATTKPGRLNTQG
jgi:hypothetical protein